MIQWRVVFKTEEISARVSQFICLGGLRCCLQMYCLQIEKICKELSVIVYSLISSATSRFMSPRNWLKLALKEQ